VTNDDIANWDAAYVLGALSAEDRLTYEEYLATNPEAVAALAELAGLPGILNLLSREEAVALDAAANDTISQARPVDLMPLLAQGAARQQKRSRRNVIALVAATAAAFLAVGVIVTATIFGTGHAPAPSATPPLQTMAPAGNGGVAASLAVTQKHWGTRLDWKCAYTADWSKNVGTYDLVVTTVDGKQIPVASWGPSGNQASGLAAATFIPTAQIRTVDVRVAGTTTPLAVMILH